MKRDGHKDIGLPQVIRFALQIGCLKKICVPDNFPLGLARELSRLKIKLKIKPGALFPARECKNAEEVKKISAALIMAEVGLAEGIQALKISKVGRNRRLLYHNAPLTSEKLRGII